MAADKEKDIDKVTGVSTTGHEWDGIKELNNPLPRWWLWVFYATIAFAAVYVVLYPAIPLVNSATGGILGWNSRTAVVSDVARLNETRGANLTAMREASIHEVVADETLVSFAQAYGRAAFGDNCAGCHGAGGGGAASYPNLLDDDWLWGGTLEDIHQTIAFGIRSSHMDTRLGSMPAFVRDGILSRQEAFVIADYVRSLNGLPVPDNADIEGGAALFQDNCAACHGDDAAGMREIGAPNLTNNIWLYGSDRAAIVEGIVNGRSGVMPHFGERLDEVTVKALAVYVHTLGGGE
jgi:cytochrome c oxidase cbb3-type subunit III